jgi:hypothetical protein
MIEQLTQQFKDVLNREMKNSIMNLHGEWTKEAVDTGLMRDTVNLVSIIVNIPDVKLEIKVNTIEYAQYVRFPQSQKNPNYKYGPRDFIAGALRQSNVIELRNKLIQEIIKKNLEIETSGLKLRNIKIDI